MGKTKNPLMEYCAKLTPEERRANSQKGGLAAGKTKQQRRSLREAALMFLEAPIEANTPEEERLLLKYPDLTVGDVIMLRQAEKAYRGSLESAEFVRDTSGQNPRQQGDTGQTEPFQINIQVIT